MKPLRKLTAAALLACVFAVAANAGDIHTPSVTAPPPPDPPPASSVASEETGETADLSDLIVTLLNGVLSVF